MASALPSGRRTDEQSLAGTMTSPQPFSLLDLVGLQGQAASPPAQDMPQGYDEAIRAQTPTDLEPEPHISIPRLIGALLLTSIGGGLSGDTQAPARMVEGMMNRREGVKTRNAARLGKAEERKFELKKGGLTAASEERQASSKGEVGQRLAELKAELHRTDPEVLARIDELEARTLKQRAQATDIPVEEARKTAELKQKGSALQQELGIKQELADSITKTREARIENAKRILFLREKQLNQAGQKELRKATAPILESAGRVYNMLAAQAAGGQKVPTIITKAGTFSGKDKLREYVRQGVRARSAGLSTESIAALEEAALDLVEEALNDFPD